MARKPKNQPTQHDEMVVRQSITSAMRSDLESAKPLVIDQKRRAVAIAHARPPPSINIRTNLLRIVEEADPLGFLISVQKGDLQPVSTVTENGDLEVRYVQPGLNQRIAVAEFLAHKILPTISIKATNPYHEDKDSQEAEPQMRPGQPGGRTFAQMVSEAATKAREHAAALPGPRQVWEAAPDGETYGDAGSDGGGSVETSDPEADDEQ